MNKLDYIPRNAGEAAAYANGLADAPPMIPTDHMIVIGSKQCGAPSDRRDALAEEMARNVYLAMVRAVK